MDIMYNPYLRSVRFLRGIPRDMITQVVMAMEDGVYVPRRSPAPRPPCPRPRPPTPANARTSRYQLPSTSLPYP